MATATEEISGIRIECLTTEKCENAEIILIQPVQKDAFPDTYAALKEKQEIKNVDPSLKPLCLIWDKENEIILIKGRIEATYLSPC